MWGLVDCDNFFCSCERVFRPDLNGKPLVVLSNNDGCVIARSGEAKAMGVRMGLPYYQMQEQYPNSGIIAFSSNYTLYGDMSARIMRILREEVPAVLQYSIDEAFLDLKGMKTEDLKAWGEALSAKILKWTGMPVSIGIAPTKTLAKIASKFAKKYPGYKKCCMIATDEQRVAALKLFPIDDVWGIGRRLTKSLAYYGIDNTYDFTLKSRGWVKQKYHVTGERTWRELNGESVIELDDMDMGKKSIMTSRSFPDMICEFGELRSHVANYAARCAAKLRKQKSVCSVISVFIQSNHFREDLEQYDQSLSYTFPTATSSTIELVGVATRILEVIFRKGIHYKRAGVMVSEFSPSNAVQLDFFTYDPEMARKYNSVSEAIDAINQRLGADTVTLGSQLYSKKDTSGKSVKFANAIKRSLKSPDYSTQINKFRVK